MNAILDAMTGGGFEHRGRLFTPRECLEGDTAVVLKYLREHLEEVVVLEAESDYAVGPLPFSTSVRHRHAAETYGIKFRQGDRTIAFLRRQPENFLLFGDYSILYGLSGKPSVSPALWFHDGLTAPPHDSAEFAAHCERMMKRVEQYQVRWVVVEGTRTSMRSRLDHCPRLSAQVAASLCEVHHFGRFHIHRLDPEDRCRRKDPNQNRG